MPSCNTYQHTWVSLTLGVGYLFTAAPAKHSLLLLTLDEGYLLTTPVTPQSQQAVVPNTPHLSFSQIGVQPCTSADKLLKAILNLYIPKHTSGHSQCLSERHDLAPPTRTHTQIPPTWKPSQGIGSIPISRGRRHS